MRNIPKNIYIFFCFLFFQAFFIFFMNATNFPRAGSGKLLEIRLSCVSLLGHRAFALSLPLTLGATPSGKGRI